MTLREFIKGGYPRYVAAIDELKRVNGGEDVIYDEALDEAVEKYVGEAISDEYIAEITWHGGGHNQIKDGTPVLKIRGDDAPYDFDIFSPNIIRLEISRALSRYYMFAYRFRDDPEKETMDAPVMELKYEFYRGYIGSSLNCSCCGAEVKMMVGIDSKKMLPNPLLRINKEPGAIACLVPERLPKKALMDIPSRKMVIANDLRSLFKEPELDSYSKERLEFYKDRSTIEDGSINSFLGQQLNTDFYLTFGLGYFQSGNMVPSILRGDEDVVIGTPAKEFCNALDKDEITDELRREIEAQEEMDVSGTISCDLWAVNIMDYDDFIGRCEVLELNHDAVAKDLDIQILDIPGDTAEVTNYYGTSKGGHGVLLDIKTPTARQYKLGIP